MHLRCSLPWCSTAKQLPTCSSLHASTGAVQHSSAALSCMPWQPGHIYAGPRPAAAGSWLVTMSPFSLVAPGQIGMAFLTEVQVLTGAENALSPIGLLQQYTNAPNGQHTTPATTPAISPSVGPSTLHLQGRGLRGSGVSFVNRCQAVQL